MAKFHYQKNISRNCHLSFSTSFNSLPKEASNSKNIGTIFNKGYVKNVSSTTTTALPDVNVLSITDGRGTCTDNNGFYGFKPANNADNTINYRKVGYKMQQKIVNNISNMEETPIADVYLQKNPTNYDKEIRGSIIGGKAGIKVTLYQLSCGSYLAELDVAHIVAGQHDRLAGAGLMRPGQHKFCLGALPAQPRGGDLRRKPTTVPGQTSHRGFVGLG